MSLASGYLLPEGSPASIELLAGVADGCRSAPSPWGGDAGQLLLLGRCVVPGASNRPEASLGNLPDAVEAPLANSGMVDVSHMPTGPRRAIDGASAADVADVRTRPGDVTLADGRTARASQGALPDSVARSAERTMPHPEAESRH